MNLRKIGVLTVAVATLFVSTSCSELHTGSSMGSSGGSAMGGSNAPREKLTQHDAALRFLTAYIRLDRNIALQYATPQAVSRLDWNVPHRGNIPYYDDKMILRFRNGWAKVYFQEVNGSFLVSDLDVHIR